MPAPPADDGLLTEVCGWEADLQRLEQCSHPGVVHQVADLKRRIAARRDEIRGTWPPARVNRRLELRAAEAQREVERAKSAHADALRVLAEAQQAVSEAAARVDAKQSVATDRQAELAAHVAAVGDSGKMDDESGPREDAPPQALAPAALLQMLMATPQGVALLAAREVAPPDPSRVQSPPLAVERERSPRRAAGAGNR